jgi:hypothetical protein
VNGGSTKDCLPKFPFPIKYIPLRPDVPPSITMSSSAQRISTAWRDRYPDRAEIMDIFDDMARVSVHLESEEHRTSGHVYNNVVFSSTVINGIIFRLLQAQPTSRTSPENLSGALQEAIRLGLLLFIAEPRRRFGLHPVNTTMHVQKLNKVITNTNLDWEGFEDLRLWITTMGILEAVEPASAKSIADEWSKTIKAQQIMVPTEAEQVFKGVMWIDTVHGKKYQKMHATFWGKGPVLRPKVIIQVFQEGSFLEDKLPETK